MDLAAARDFFISYTTVDVSWARWVAVELERAGHSTLLQDFDFRPGSDFLHEMQEATSICERTIALLSPAYFGSAFSEAEWRAAFAKDPTGRLGLLIPVRVQPFTPKGLLASRIYVDLVQTDEPTSRQRLLDAVNRSLARPRYAVFPGVSDHPLHAGAQVQSHLPGSRPEISSLSSRIPLAQSPPSRWVTDTARTAQGIAASDRNVQISDVSQSTITINIDADRKIQAGSKVGSRSGDEPSTLQFLAAELSKLASLLAQAGRLDEAIQKSSETVEIYRRLAEEG